MTFFCKKILLGIIQNLKSLSESKEKEINGVTFLSLKAQSLRKNL